MPTAKQNKIKVQVVDMKEDVRNAAVDTIKRAFDNFSKEDRIANEIRTYFDKHHEPSWNVIVGKNFGAHVINQTECYMFATLNDDEISVLMWKSWAVAGLIGGLKLLINYEILGS